MHQSWQVIEITNLNFARGSFEKSDTELNFSASDLVITRPDEYSNQVSIEAEVCLHLGCRSHELSITRLTSSDGCI